MSDSKSLAIIPRGVDECMSLAAELSKATTVSAELRDKPANVLAAMMAGMELGFSPMAALRSMHIIKGVPKLSADAMVAAVLASGKAEYFEPTTYTTTSVTFVTKRVGSNREQACTWTQEDAKRAGLVNDNHRLYPRQMLAARAKSELARLVYPDVCAGVYTDEEMPVSIDRDIKPENIIDAEVVSETTAEPPELAQIDTAESLEALNALAPALGKLSKQWKAVARTRWTARENALKGAAA